MLHNANVGLYRLRRSFLPPSLSALELLMCHSCGVYIRRCLCICNNFDFAVRKEIFWAFCPTLLHNYITLMYSVKEMGAIQVNHLWSLIIMTQKVYPLQRTIRGTCSSLTNGGRYTTNLRLKLTVMKRYKHVLSCILLCILASKSQLVCAVVTP